MQNFNLLVCCLSIQVATCAILAQPEWTSTPLAQLHKLLVNTPSVTGTERHVGEVLVDYLESLDFTVERQPVRDDRFNVYAYMGPESARRTSVLLTSHIDTVPPFYEYDIRGNGSDIWGRGSVDAKASIAAMVEAFLNLRKAKAIFPGDLGLLFVIEEETSGLGMRAVNELSPDLQWDTVIFGEPTEGKLACGHKGLTLASLTIHGRSAHSGYPWLGDSAVNKMVRVLGRLLETEFPHNKKYGNTTLNLGTVRGGSAANVVADKAEAEFSFRLAAGTVENVENIVEGVIKDIVGKDGWEIEWSANAYMPQDCACDVPGFKTTTVNYGTDIPNLLGNHTRYLYGPGSIFVAHSDHEHLTFAELEDAVKGYEKIVKHALKVESDQNEL